MKCILSFFVIGIFLYARNDRSESSNRSSDSTGIKTVDSSSEKTAEQPTPNFPTDLTLDETTDDSIFADGSRPVPWTNAGIDDPVAFRQFLKKLQKWVAADQKDSVVTVIAFPLHNPKVKDQQAFLAKYDLYINDRVKNALKHQNLRQIFRNANGAMIGSGELWLGQVQGGFAIIAINNK